MAFSMDWHQLLNSPRLISNIAYIAVGRMSPTIKIVQKKKDVAKWATLYLIYFFVFNHIMEFQVIS